MNETVSFVMGRPDPKRHSVKFAFLKLDSDLVPPSENEKELAERFQNMAFYIPRPFAQHARKIRVTVEVVEE